MQVKFNGHLYSNDYDVFRFLLSNERRLLIKGRVMNKVIMIKMHIIDISSLHA